jgi:hypothetical protein
MSKEALGDGPRDLPAIVAAKVKQKQKQKQKLLNFLQPFQLV